MKKHEIIQSKHVDHIENEKNILQMIYHPFIVSELTDIFLSLPFIDEILWFHARR